MEEAKFTPHPSETLESIWILFQITVSIHGVDVTIWFVSMQRWTPNLTDIRDTTVYRRMVHTFISVKGNG